MLTKELGILFISIASYLMTSYSEILVAKDKPISIISIAPNPPLVEVRTHKLIYDGDFKPRYKILIANNTKLSVIGYNLTISLYNSRTKISKCEFDVKKKQTISYKKSVQVTGDIPKFEKMCDYDDISVMLTGVVFSDGTLMSGLQLLLGANKVRR